jgi:hypothetical protein
MEGILIWRYEPERGEDWLFIGVSMREVEFCLEHWYGISSRVITGNVSLARLASAAEVRRYKSMGVTKLPKGKLRWRQRS